ncbi:MAG: DUF6270 domain-containing protein [Clostridium sp.]
MNIEKILYDSNTSEVKIIIDEKNKKQIIVRFIERNSLENVLLESPLKFDVTINYYESYYKFKLRDYNILKEAEIWDMYIMENGVAKVCNILENVKFEFNKFDDTYIKPYKTQNGRCAIHSKKNNLSIDIRAKFKNNRIVLINLNKDRNLLKIRLKKRVHGQVFNYNEVKEFVMKKDEFEIDMNIFNKEKIVDGEIWDIFIVGNEERREKEIQLNVGEWKPKEIVLDHNSKVKIYKNVRSGISIYLKTIIKVEIKEVTLNDHFLMIGLNTNIDTLDCSIDKIRFLDYSNGFYDESKKIDVIYIYDNKKICVWLKSLFNNKSKRNINTIVQLVINGNGAEYRVIGRYKKNINKESEEYSAVLDRGRLEEGVIIAKRKKEKKVRIGVLGSCYTRRMFTSESYYNIGYKNKYIVDFTQFHSSIIALVNEFEMRYNTEIFQDSEIVESMKKSIDRELENTFFEELKEAKLDYLLLDLYIDFQMGIIKFENGKIVSRNTNLINKSRFLESIEEKYKILIPSNEAEYLEIWEKSANKFSEKLKEIFDERQIIIHICNATEQYIDKDGSIKYWDDLQGIRGMNILASYMGDYLAKILPDSIIIDSRNLNYIGDASSPDGLTKHHYESGYYKEVLNLVDEAIIKS